MPTRPISLIVVHCTATPDGASLFTRDQTPLEVIDEWHLRHGFRRAPQMRQKHNPALVSIGYHFVVYIDGTVATGRAVDEAGAHARGFNAHSIGIALIGTERFTSAQWASLASLVTKLCAAHDIPDRWVNPAAAGSRALSGVCGHRDLSEDLDKSGSIEPPEFAKVCPGFDVRAWFDGGKKAVPAHVHAVDPTAPPPARIYRTRGLDA